MFFEPWADDLMTYRIGEKNRLLFR